MSQDSAADRQRTYSAGLIQKGAGPLAFRSAQGTTLVGIIALARPQSISCTALGICFAVGLIDLMLRTFAVTQTVGEGGGRDAVYHGRHHYPSLPFRCFYLGLHEPTPTPTRTPLYTQCYRYIRMSNVYGHKLHGIVLRQTELQTQHKSAYIYSHTAIIARPISAVEHWYIS